MGSSLWILLPVSTWLLVTNIYGLDAREFKALCCLALVPRHSMKHGVVHCRPPETRLSGALTVLTRTFSRTAKPGRTR
jgi:hypothetical protein